MITLRYSPRYKSIRIQLWYFKFPFDLFFYWVLNYLSSIKVPLFSLLSRFFFLFCFGYSFLSISFYYHTSIHDIFFYICLLYISSNILFFFMSRHIYLYIFLVLFSPPPTRSFSFSLSEMNCFKLLNVFVVDTEFQYTGRNGVKNHSWMPPSFSIVSEYINKTRKIVFFREGIELSLS